MVLKIFFVLVTQKLYAINIRSTCVQQRSSSYTSYHEQSYFAIIIINMHRVYFKANANMAKSNENNMCAR